jgi:hypothetical protein
MVHCFQSTSSIWGFGKYPLVFVQPGRSSIAPSYLRLFNARIRSHITLFLLRVMNLVHQPIGPEFHLQILSAPLKGSTLLGNCVFLLCNAHNSFFFVKSGLSALFLVQMGYCCNKATLSLYAETISLGFLWMFFFWLIKWELVFLRHPL